MAKKKTDGTAGKKSSTAKSSATKSKAGAAKGQAEATSAPSQNPALVDEIHEIITRLDDNGLETLLDAARAVETKRKIENFNRELNVAAEKASKRRRELSAPEYRVSIERTEDDFFIIQLDDVRVFFNRQEMREITAICHKAAASGEANSRGAPQAAARRLFKWFEKERSDLLVDAGINSERNPYLIDLYQVVVSTYKVKE